MPTNGHNVLTKLPPTSKSVSNSEEKPLPLVPFSPPSQSISLCSAVGSARARKGLPRNPVCDNRQEYQDAATQYIDAVLKLAKLELNEQAPQATDARDQVFDRAIELNSSRLVFHSCSVSHASVSGKELEVISIPSSASTTTSSGSKGISAAQSSAVRCSGWTRSGSQCKRTVKSTAGLAIHVKDVDCFCHQHRTRLLAPTGFYRGNAGDLIEFNDWIPKYLHADTQAALRLEMEKPLSTSDGPGYIYAFEIRDPSSDKFRIKVGRAVNVARRIDEWERQCKTHEHVLRGFYPEVDDNSKSNKPVSRLKGLLQLGDPAPWCHRLERLIHLELADLAARASYLDRAWPDVSPSRKSEVPPATTPSNCIDCGKTHLEIFDFARPKQSKLRKKEWELVILPVIRKWGQFTSQHL